MRIHVSVGHAPELVEREESLEELGVRDATDMDEHGRDGQLRRLAGGEIAHAQALDASFAEDRLERRPVPDLDLLALEDAPAVRLLTVERLLGVDEHHPNVVARELERLEQRRVAASDHRDDLAPEQRPVAARRSG